MSACGQYGVLYAPTEETAEQAAQQPLEDEEEK